jgi:flagella basal body P-ring formation protein FlgA
MTRFRASRRIAMARTLAFWLLALAAPALAGSRGMLVPTQVIYPGDKINDSMLVVSQDPVQGAAPTDILWDRADIVGKVARRTLLPGRPIPSIAVEEPRAVSTGSQVQLVYEQEGIVIVTTAQALQNGYVGQVVQVRNMDSGQVVSGLVQSDGSIRVNGG